MFAALALVLLIAGLSKPSSSPQPPQKPKTAAEEARDQARGMAIEATKQLRDAMNDPASFQLDQALFMDDNSACYLYRARNGFNALRQSTAVFTGTQVLIPGSKGYNAAWNRHCEGRHGEDVTAYIRMNVL